MNRTLNWNVTPRSHDPNNYSTFNTCLKNTEFNNPFWTSIFESCASGRLPPGFSWICKERKIVYTPPNNEGPQEVYELPSRGDSILTTTYIVNVFRSKGITPPKGALNTPTTSKYSDIKGKNFLINAISIFIEQESRQLQLSGEQRRQLSNVIAILLMNKKLNDSNISMKNGYIIGINCIRFNGSNYTIV